jgi:hypothetical protein
VTETVFVVGVNILLAMCHLSEPFVEEGLEPLEETREEEDEDRADERERPAPAPGADA